MFVLCIFTILLDFDRIKCANCFVETPETVYIGIVIQIDRSRNWHNHHLRRRLTVVPVDSIDLVNSVRVVLFPVHFSHASHPVIIYVFSVHSVNSCTPLCPMFVVVRTIVVGLFGVVVGGDSLIVVVLVNWRCLLVYLHYLRAVQYFPLKRQCESPILNYRS